MINFKLSTTEAMVAITNVETKGHPNDVAMCAFVSLYGAAGVDLLYSAEEAGTEQHDDAWNALGALETCAKNPV